MFVIFHLFHFLPNLPLSSKSSAEEMEEMSFFHFLPPVRKKVISSGRNSTLGKAVVQILINLSSIVHHFRKVMACQYELNLTGFDVFERHAVHLLVSYVHQDGPECVY